MRKFSGIWLILIWSLVVYCIIDPVSKVYTLENVRFLSFIGIINMVVVIITWKIAGGEGFCAYTVFCVVLFAFCYGQSVGWYFGLDMGSKDLYYRISIYTIINSMIYSLLCMIAIHIGALFSIREKRASCKNVIDPENMIYSIEKVGKLFAWASVPFYVIDTLYTLYNVIGKGYIGAYNTLAVSLGQIGTLIAMISNFFIPALICLFVVYRNHKRKKNFILIILLIDVIKTLYIGGRSGAVMVLLVIVLMYHYCVKRFKFWQSFIVGILGYVGMAVLNAIAVVRVESNKSISMVLEVIGGSFANVFGEFFGELGWSMSSLMHTMEFVPSIQSFRYGKSYLYGLTAAIPNVGIWQVHPAKIHSNLGDWLQNMLDIDYGPGYTAIAEFYINFGWYGVLVAIIVGYIVARILGSLNKDSISTNPLSAVMVFLVMLLLLKPMVRSSFSAVVRSLVYNVCVYYVFIKMIYIQRVNSLLKKK